MATHGGLLTAAYGATRSVVGNTAANRIAYAVRHRRLLKLSRPTYFSEYVVRRMLRERSESIVWTCDKLEAKDRVAAMGVHAAIPETLWSGRDVREIGDAGLHGDWVLKPNDGGGGQVDFGSGNPTPDVVARLAARNDGYANPWHHNGEWAYSQARAGYLVERLLGAPPLPDYKVLVIWGHAVVVDVHTGRFGPKARQTFTRDWVPLTGVYADSQPGTTRRPACLDDMLADAETIAAGFDFLRVDFYIVDGVLYFGETTPYPGAGRHRVAPAFDRFLGTLCASRSTQAVRARRPAIGQFASRQEDRTDC